MKVEFLSPEFWEKVRQIASEKGVELTDEDMTKFISNIASQYVKENLKIDSNKTMLKFLKDIDDIINYEKGCRQSDEIRRNVVISNLNSSDFKPEPNKQKVPKHISSLDVVEEMILKNKRIETMHEILNQMKNIIDSLADNCTSNNEDFDIIMGDLNDRINAFLSEHSKYVDEEEIRSLLRSLDNSNSSEKYVCSGKCKIHHDHCNDVVVPREIADIVTIISSVSEKMFSENSSNINAKIQEFLENPRIRFE